MFGYVVGPHSWKKFLHPPEQRLWRAERQGDGFQILEEEETPPKYAFIGVRSCEIHAIAVQDKVFINGKYVDSGYKARRENAFIVAVNCGESGGTCFCVSMKTGPKASFGYDLALTEVLEGEGAGDNLAGHYFVVEVGSERGAEILDEIEHREADEKERKTAENIAANTARQMGRTMDSTGIKELLYRNYENPRWDNVAARCLTCGNCTMACPTCFCTTGEDVTDLTGEHAERWQK